MERLGLYLMGQKGLAVLRALTDYRHNIAFVVASRDVGVQRDYFEDIKALAMDYQVCFVERGVESVLPMVNHKIAVGWRWMIADCFNLIVIHDSLLPRYKGFSPLVAQLINGEEVLGATALFANGKYDDGDIIAQESFYVSYPIKVADAISKMCSCYEKLALQIVPCLCQGGNLHAHKQDSSAATYSPWRDDADYYIDWARSAQYIRRFVDAVGSPYAGARTTIRDKEVVILEVELHDDVVIEDRHAHIGKTIFVEDGCPVVICGDGLLKIKDWRSVGGLVRFRTRFGVCGK